MLTICSHYLLVSADTNQLSLFASATPHSEAVASQAAAAAWAAVCSHTLQDIPVEVDFLNLQVHFKHLSNHTRQLEHSALAA